MKRIKGKTHITNQDIYIFQIKEKCKYCWLGLLLLLPLLLFIPISKTVKLQLSNFEINEIIEEEVFFQYRKRELFSFDKMSFFTNDLVGISPLKGITNGEGIVQYNTSYTLYQWVSSFWSDQDIAKAWSENSSCYLTDSTYNYFELHHNGIDDLYANSKRENFIITVVDADDDNEPLPDAMITIESAKYHLQDSGLTDNEGKIELQNIPICTDLILSAKKYGWYSDSINYTQFYAHITDDTLFLKQQKEVVKFYVQDAILKEPIVGILGHLSFNENSNEVIATAKTNVNGIAKGVFEEVHKIQLIGIHVNKKHAYAEYNDTASINSHGWKKVVDWNKQDDKQKILYLDKTQIAFKTVDKNNKTLIPNVKLVIQIDGQSLDLPNDSGQGEFTIKHPTKSSMINIQTEKDCYIENPVTINSISIQELRKSFGEPIPILMEKGEGVI